MTATSLNIRSAPSTNGILLGSFAQGQQVTIAAQEGEWLRVSLRGGQQGWINSRYVSETAPAPAQPTPTPPALSGPSRAEIVQLLIARSLRSYSGNCPCPYNVDRAGRRCGGRSAHSRRGGAAPLCFESDVTEAMIRSFHP